MSDRRIGVALGSWYCGGMRRLTCQQAQGARSRSYKAHLGQEEDKVVQILVVNARLPTEIMLKRDSKRLEQVEHGLLLKKRSGGIAIPEISVLDVELGVIGAVKPDETGSGPRGYLNLLPELASSACASPRSQPPYRLLGWRRHPLDESLVRRAGTIRDAETEDRLRSRQC